MSRFRPATTQDVDSVLAMMCRYYEEDGYPFARRQAKRALLELIDNRTHGRLWVVTDGELVIGYLAVTLGFSLEYGGRDAFVDELFIHEGHRRQGLGREALEVAETYCRRQGVRVLHLEVETHREAAARLYRQLGFRGHERTLMSKWLLETDSTDASS